MPENLAAHAEYICKVGVALSLGEDHNGAAEVELDLVHPQRMGAISTEGFSMWSRPKIFPYEREGRVVIVKPAGDTLSVEERQLKKEIDALHAVIDHVDCQHLVVDLSGAPYFGSIVIGAMMALCGKVKNKNGRAALSNATQGVHDSIQIMKLDTAVPYFPTREEALAYVQEQ